MSLRVWAYAGCATCRQAQRFLAERKIAHELLAIREHPPGTAELRAMLAHTGGELRRLFNTSGQDYRALNLKDRLPQMSVDEALALLTTNGNLMKRPFALAQNRGTTGFKPEEWARLFC